MPPFLLKREKRWDERESKVLSGSGPQSTRTHKTTDLLLQLLADSSLCFRIQIQSPNPTTPPHLARNSTVAQITLQRDKRERQRESERNQLQPRPRETALHNHSLSPSLAAMDVGKSDPNPNPNANPSPLSSASTALSPKPQDANPNPNVNPYPTTFVQADTSSFKQVVQLLTGSPQTVSAASKPATPTTSTSAATAPKKTPFKPAQQLYERRAHTRNLRIIRPVNVMPASMSPFPGPNSPVLSPSMLDFPSLALSPVTPLVPDPFNKPPAGSEAATFAEEKAIAEKGFYLHPSPRGIEPPRLLPLFPVASPTAGLRAGCGSSPNHC